MLAFRSRSLVSILDAASAFRRACLYLRFGPLAVPSLFTSASALPSSSRAPSSTRSCELTVLALNSLFLASILSLAVCTSPWAFTSASSLSFSSSISSISSWSSAAFSVAASRTPFLPFSAIHWGTSWFASFSSAALHAAQRLAHLASSSTISSIHFGVSLPSAFMRFDSATAHFALPLFSSSDTILSIHSGTVSFFSSMSFTAFLAHSRVMCCCMRSLRCFQVSWLSSLHHVGAFSGRRPKEPSLKSTVTSSSERMGASSSTVETLDCRRMVPSCWAIAPTATSAAEHIALSAMAAQRDT
mmetsp:Transcript_68692/g.182506  ORF Transcript_68692/g.182506 Transcript_68692/m.182506 type:complete len:301 (-) Transcript_68692:55-957(-)